MIIDILALVLLVVAVFKGWRKGLVVAVFSLLAFIVGMAAALKLSAIVANRLGAATNISQRWLPVLAFAIVFFLAALLVRLGAKAIEGAMQLAMLGWLNKLAGIVLYVVLYFMIFSVALFYAEQLHLIKPETIAASATYGYIHPVAPKVIAGLSKALPFLRDTFGDLEQFFDGLA